MVRLADAWRGGVEMSTGPNMAMPTGHLSGIHALRGIAALMVFLFHLHYVGQIPLPRSWGLIASHGGMGVELFYVLSAFSLLYSNQKYMRSGDSQWIFGYLTKRFFRIAPLFYTMLAVHCLLILFVFNGKLDIQRIILSVLFIFNFIPNEAQGIVWASWSIGVEMVFYAFFPLIMVSIRSLRASVVLWFVAVLASYIYRRTLEADPGLPTGYAQYAFMSQLGVFCAGILGYWTFDKINSSIDEVRRKLWWLVVVLGPGTVFLLLSDSTTFLIAAGRPDTQLWALAFSFIAVLSVVSAKRWMAHPILEYFGERSYSIYLTHTVMIHFTGSLIRRLYEFFYPTLGGYGFAVCALTALIPTLLVSEVTYQFIEVRGIALGKRFLTSHVTGGDCSFGALTTGLRANSKVQRLDNEVVWFYMLQVIGIGALLFSAFVTFRYIQQPLVDSYAFRQTQTALTAYWMLKEGWTLAYQTPFAGFPWSIPLEFPLYQALVAAISALSGFDLAAVGRFVSYMFLAALAWPTFAISRRLDLPKSVPWVFCALLWTSPLNVYWGRTFMIETTALFFSFACMPYAIDLIRRVGGWPSTLLFVIFATAAVLQKATTGGPVLLFLLSAALFVHVRPNGLSFQTFRQLFYPVMVIGIPLVVGLAWTQYTDAIKAANPLGIHLTSKVLTAWNFGSMKQRLDFETWRLVVWERSLKWNAGGLLGVLLLLTPWIVGREHRRFAWLSLAALVLFVLPILIFTNLHIIHEYYQLACVAFLLAALAIVIGGWLQAVSGSMLVVTVVTAAIMLSNITVFNSYYGVVAKRSLDEQNPLSVQAYKVGRYLREHTAPDTGLVIFGQDYSSEIAFQSQRKTMTAPIWFREYEQLWKNPQAYLGDVQLSAIAICPPTNQFPSLADLQERLAKEAAWVHETVYGCELLLSPTTRVTQ